MGRPPPLAPFLARPEYLRLPRPHDTPRKSPHPRPPPALPGIVAAPAIARVAQRLRITIREIDERLSVEDILDEIDLSAYLFDEDVEPVAEPQGGADKPPRGW